MVIGVEEGEGGVECVRHLLFVFASHFIKYLSLCEENDKVVAEKQA